MHLFISFAVSDYKYLQHVQIDKNHKHYYWKLWLARKKGSKTYKKLSFLGPNPIDANNIVNLNVVIYLR